MCYSRHPAGIRPAIDTLTAPARSAPCGAADRNRDPIMTTTERLLAIVDAADPANVGCPPGTCATCDDRLAARPDWLAVRRLAEAMPELESTLEEWTKWARSARPFQDKAQFAVLTLSSEYLLRKLRTPNPEPPA